MTAPRLAHGAFRVLTLADAPELQELFARCDDYFLLSEGTPTPADMAEKELASLAPNATAEDMFSFGIERSGELVGFLNVARNYPKPQEWWIGFLLLDPSVRGTGLGSEVHRALREWIVAQSGTTLWLGVLEQNEPAKRFWHRMGYRERERQRWTAASGLVSNVILMSLALATV